MKKYYLKSKKSDGTGLQYIVRFCIDEDKCSSDFMENLTPPVVFLEENKTIEKLRKSWKNHIDYGYTRISETEGDKIYSK